MLLIANESGTHAICNQSIDGRCPVTRSNKCGDEKSFLFVPHQGSTQGQCERDEKDRENEEKRWSHILVVELPHLSWWWGEED